MEIEVERIVTKIGLTPAGDFCDLNSAATRSRPWNFKNNWIK